MLREARSVVAGITRKERREPRFRPVVQDDGRRRATSVTDDPAVVVERDTAVVAVELGPEKREARRIRRYSVAQSHATTVVENAALRAEVVRADHGPDH